MAINLAREANSVVLITYDVIGQLVDAHTRRAVSSIDVIIETGMRDESSPLNLYGIKRSNPETDQEGSFHVKFFTNGTHPSVRSAPLIPKYLEIHVSSKPDEWKCQVIPVKDEMVLSSQKLEVRLNLGLIAIT